MEILIFIMLFFAGLIAGIVNAIAGGGTFFTFPVFLAAGLPPIVANASNAIAVWPGHAFATIGYRNELVKHREGLGKSMLIALIGGTLGAFLLIFTGNQAFTKLIPFLILFATIIFAYGAKLNTIVSSFSNSGKHGLLGGFLEFIFALYGGFFGAGLGIMLMAGLQILGYHDIQANNALKNLLSTIIASVAVAIFAFLGIVSWSHALVAFAGASVGGLLGARFAQWLSAVWLHRIVIVFGMFLSVYYFIMYYG